MDEKNNPMECKKIPEFPKAPLTIGWGPNTLTMREEWLPINVQMAFPLQGGSMDGSKNGMREQTKRDSWL
jgi:hypothetical protein